MRAFTIALVTLLCGLLIWCRWRQGATRQKRAAAPSDFGWAQIHGAKVAVPDKGKEEWDIREATFLHQTRGLGANPCYLEANCSPRSKDADSDLSKTIAPPAQTVAIELPDEFLKRIAEKGRNLKRISECEVTADGVVDKKTGQAGGCIFTVGDIFWISPADVEVSGGLGVGTAARSSKTYYLKKVGGGWQIVGEHLKSIS